MADSKEKAKMSKVRTDRCPVCLGIRLNEMCISRKCPMFGKTPLQSRNAVRIGLAASQSFSSKGFDAVTMARNSRMKSGEVVKGMAARGRYWRNVGNVSATK
jgi:hypothetical protein